MLIAITALLVLAAVCFASLRGPGAPDPVTAGEWRQVALDERADARLLRAAVVAAVESRDDTRRQRILQQALAECEGYHPVHCTL